MKKNIKELLYVIDLFFSNLNAKYVITGYNYDICILKKVY